MNAWKTALLLPCAAGLFGQSFNGPVTGVAVPVFAAVDQTVENLLTGYRVPGAALAVSYQGRLIYARGFGYASTQTSTPVQPDSLFRTASVSKEFTASAVLKLIEQGKLTIDQPAFALLSDLQPAPGQTLNPALASITIGELLNHTSGLHNNAAGDPMQTTDTIAYAMNAPAPGNCDTIIRYELSQPLQNDPGTTFSYSNLGYCVLDSIIEHVSGMSYEQFVRQTVLLPLGIQRAKLADPLMSDTLNGEVTYYDPPGAPLTLDIYNPGGPPVPAPYGGPASNFLAKEATGGWATTAIDLLRLLNGLDGVQGKPLFAPSTIQLMETEAPAFGAANSYYGYGMEIDRTAGGFGWWKDGGYPGTISYIYRYPNTLAFAIIFNSAPASAGFEASAVSEIKAAIPPTSMLPATDQFPAFASTLIAPVPASSNPVVSSASGLPGIVPGSWVTIYGTNLATASRMWRTDEFGPVDFSLLPLSVDSVSVIINGKPAAIYYVSPTQLNVQAPTDTATGPVSVVVTHDGQSSPPVQAVLMPAAPAWFTWGSGTLFAAAIHMDGTTIGDPSQYPGTSPAKSGETIEIFGTGFTPSPGGTENIPSTLLTPLPVVTVGGIQATVVFAGLTSPGLFQVNIVIPSLAPGVYPVTVTWGGTASPSVAQIPISL